MAVRIISGIVGIALLCVVLLLGKIYLTFAIFILSILGLNELNKALERKGYKPFVWIGYLWAFIIFFSRYIPFFDEISKSLFEKIFYPVSIFVSIAILLTIMVFKNKKHTISDIGITIFGIIYIVYLFSFLPDTRLLPNGEYIIWIVFVGAWVTDTSAYFSGYFFGKRKILPEISPKKTLEGSIGGFLGCALIMTLYGYYLIHWGILNINIIHFIIVGLVCGIVSQIGDWVASAIKRYCGVKDFGALMPGHGGVLDRFDSILFIAPFVYLYALIFFR